MRPGVEWGLGAMQVVGIGRFIFWKGGSLWIGMALDRSEFHAHHAIQLGIGIGAPVQFRPDTSLPWTHYPAAVIPSNLPHMFQSPGNQVANMFIEPESVVGRRITEKYGAGAIAGLGHDEARRLAAPLARLYNDGADDQTLAEAARQTFQNLADETGPEADAADPRVLRAIEEIASRLDEPLTLARLARVAGLSESRFRHLFVAETGVSLRAYILWARLNRALDLGFGGASWTEAAHAANFADSAHLTRTCRRMFGLAPTSTRLDRTQGSGRMPA